MGYAPTFTSPMKIAAGMIYELSAAVVHSCTGFAAWRPSLAFQKTYLGKNCRGKWSGLLGHTDDYDGGLE